MLVENYNGRILTDFKIFQCERCDTVLTDKRCFYTPELNTLCGLGCCASCMLFCCMQEDKQDTKKWFEDRIKHEQQYLESRRRSERDRAENHEESHYDF